MLDLGPAHRSRILSDGEAERVKLAREHGKLERGTRDPSVLDEPAPGWRFATLDRLLVSSNRLADDGPSTVVIERKLDVLEPADHVVDLGSEGGDDAGRPIASDMPEEVAARKAAHPGKPLAALLSPHT